jgi:hypothetical protein
MSINETTIERLLTLARFDPVAHAASGLLDSGTPLEECLIAAAEVWSRRCRGPGSAVRDHAASPPEQPRVAIQAVTAAIDLGRSGWGHQRVKTAGLFVSKGDSITGNIGSKTTGVNGDVGISGAATPLGGVGPIRARND